jgi:hypothetical protein
MHALTRCFDRLRPAAVRAGIVVLALLLPATAAWAHKASDAYLQLTGTDSGFAVRLDVALRDLDAVVDIDADGNGQLTWGEVRAAWPAIVAYAKAHLQVDGCVLGAPTEALEKRTDGVYAALTFTSSCAPKGEPIIRYTAFADVDPTHRGIARISLPGQEARVRVLDPRQPVALGAPAVADAGAPAVASKATSAAQAPAGFLSEGVHHILTGYDHVLFLMCLLFPAVMRRTGRGWQPLPTLREAVWPVIGIVTAFTVAHSITLALAALKLVSLPSWFIEPGIAVTIILAALNNLWPIFRGRVVLVTFAFGLLHGFGFAGVLGELNLPTAEFAWALLQFNIGLELGQVAIVLVAISLMFLARNSQRYVPLVIRGGSAAALLIALLWFIERTADVSLLSL